MDRVSAPVWRDADAAGAYLASDLLVGLEAIVSDFQVGRFELLDGLDAPQTRRDRPRPSVDDRV